MVFSSLAYWLAASFLETLFNGNLQAVVKPESWTDLNGILKYYTSLLIVSDSSQATLTRASLAIVFAFLGKNLFAYLQLYYDSFIEQKVIKDLRDQLVGKLIKQDLAYFQSVEQGSLVSTVLNDVETLNMALNKSFTKLIRDPLNALILLVLLFIVNSKLTLIALVIVPTLGWIVLWLGRKIKASSSDTQENLSRMTSHLQETLQGIRIVRAFAAEQFEKNRFARILQDTYRSSLKRERLRRLIIPLNEFVGVVILSGILYAGGEQVLVHHSMDSEDFIRFLVLLFALMNPLISLGDLTANIRLAEAAGKRVFSVLDSKSELLRPSHPKIPGSFRELSLENVSFRYQDDQPYVLQNITLRIKKGEHVAIVGPSGSGKSTLVHLLLRFYDPTEGSITWNGVPLSELDLEQLRSRFGWVTQQVILFHTSIIGNIGYGISAVSTEKIMKAAEQAYADEFIRELTDGYDTLVGERGQLFSGGQRQRLSIARALLRNPEIVVFDEATSSLDPQSEGKVTAALNSLAEGRTVITVTHRLATIHRADRIYVLGEGRILDSGTHQELISRCEPYRIIAHQQKLDNPRALV